MSQTKIVAAPGKQEVILSRTFDAPRELVYEVYTDPKLMPEWWGPEKYGTRVDEMDVRRGGSWRFVNVDGGGMEYAFRGVYHETLSPELLVYTNEFEGMPGAVGLVTVTFEELPEEKTLLTEVNLFPSVDARDAAVQSGMAEGASETMNRLAALLAKRRDRRAEA